MAALSPAALVQHVFAEIWNRGHLPLIDELFAPDYRGWVFPDLPSARSSRERLKQCLTYVRAAVPDWQISILYQFGLDAVVITHWRGVGTHRGLFLGQPPHGQPVRVSGMSITRLVAGQISEHWDHWNRQALLRQLATAPALATGGVWADAESAGGRASVSAQRARGQQRRAHPDHGPARRWHMDGDEVHAAAAVEQLRAQETALQHVHDTSGLAAKLQQVQTDVESKQRDGIIRLARARHHIEFDAG